MRERPLSVHPVQRHERKRVAEGLFGQGRLSIVRDWYAGISPEAQPGVVIPVSFISASGILWAWN
jgi:hypothetical protein